MAAKKKDYLFNPERNPLFRDDYRPSEYKIPEASLHISLDDEKTIVRNRFQVEINHDALPYQMGPLVLNGENLKLKSAKISLDGKTFRDLAPAEYLVTDKNFILKWPEKKPFFLEFETEINPKANTELQGIYKAGDILCSQCEAQGFRRISYFLDRPDNLSVFTVTLEADKKQYPVLLSNGNGDYTKTKDLGNGRHEVTWTDPWPKPSYLFATVAGDMEVLEDTFTTMSGKKVDLRIFVQPGYEDKIGWAMESVKRSMKWDETRYGREYDLDCFHIVAVDKFNAGAMENKGLNIFNVSYLVGSPETSTDAELIGIESVIAHEYFHNWTGDRITLRDWFELTLKEGLTVLRDRQFTSDMHSAAIQTVDDAIELRSGQFMEDASPAAHPIRPDRVEEFDNIYSGTIYTKGSHVLGMLHTMLGETTWRLAMDEYFNRYDGQAVSCDHFLKVMEDVSGIDLGQFRRWYSQSGTPEISYSGVYDTAAKTYTLTLTQNTPATPDQPQSEKQPLHMPIAVGLIAECGKDAVPTRVLHLTEKTQEFVFENVEGPVVPSILRGFSAPVKIATQPSDEELLFRATYDSDPFNRYEATERLMIKTIHGLIDDHKAGKPLTLKADFLDAYLTNLQNATDGDMAFAARTLQLPSYNIITQGLKTIDPDAVHDVIDFLRVSLARTFDTEFDFNYRDTHAPTGETFNVVPAQVGRRDLHNLSLSFIGKLETPEAIAAAKKQYYNATNMTEKLGALSVLSRIDAPEAEKALADFYDKTDGNLNLINKWLGITASIPHGDVLGRIEKLMQHEAFDKTTPNKVYAVVGGLAGANPAVFHKKDGSGYKFLADLVIELNSLNPRTGANIVKRLTQFQRYDEDRQKLMLDEMRRIMATPNLDTGIKELVGQALTLADENQKAARTFTTAAKPE